MSGSRIHFTASQKPDAVTALDRMVRRYGQTDVEKAEVIVALGGDGLMLETLRGRYADRVPVYGMHRGTVGFLMNEYSEENLPARLNSAVRAQIHPLELKAATTNGKTSTLLAINEVSLLRQTPHCRRRPRTHGGTRSGWCAGRDPRRLHGLQSFRPWPHPAYRGERAGADPHLALPAPALARRPAAPRCEGRHRSSGTRPPQ